MLFIRIKGDKYLYHFLVTFRCVCRYATQENVKLPREREGFNGGKNKELITPSAALPLSHFQKSFQACFITFVFDCL